MELYLDSADLKEIEAAFKAGFLTGLTTTPTFMHREGITDIDATILKLADMVPVLQVEALGNNADEICAEAYRLLGLGLSKEKTVFKIPVSMEGCIACKRLTDEGIKVNIHLVYTLQQAYMAMQAGATYVCPLVGRLQDQGHDALQLVEQCVQAVNRYGYSSKIMFSSVRHAEHVRNAINIGVHTITVPYKILLQLPVNNFTTLGTNQFVAHTKLMTYKVKDLLKGGNPIVNASMPVAEAIVKMTEYGFGCVTVIDDENNVKGVFTDGDLRRLLEKEGREVLHKNLSDLEFKAPVTVEAQELLNAASELFHLHEVDNLLVTENGKAVGMLDIQDLK